MTFDGSGWFDFMGTCPYYLAKTKGISKNDPMWFSVMAKNEHRGRNKRVSYLRHVTIQLFEGEIVEIKLEKNRVAKVILYT